MRWSLVVVACLYTVPAAAATQDGALPWWVMAGFISLSLLCIFITSLWWRARRPMPVPAGYEPPFHLLHDEISGLPNKWLVKQDFLTFITSRPQAQLALVLVKIDQFERVNQLLGYSHANLVLSQIARRLNQAAGAHQGILALSRR